MASWQSIALNQVLFRTIRSRLEQCRDLVDMRPLVSRLDQFGTFYSMPDDLKQTRLSLAGVDCDWIEMPASRDDRLVLYFHGGGFCFKSPRTHAGLLGRLCQQSRACGVMVDYRLAPEHPFPAAIEDCFAVYRQLLNHGIHPERIVLAGDSAGGNLVLSTLLMIRDHGLPNPAGGVMMSPATDMTLTGQSALKNYLRDPFFNFQCLFLMRNNYLKKTPPSNPLVSPCFAELSGLPPLMIQVGEREILLDDSTRVAEKATADGVQVNLRVWDGMPHVFPVFNHVPEAREAMNEMGAFIVDRVA